MATVASSTATASAESRKNVVTKPEKPSQEAFKKAESAAKKEHDDAQKALNDIKKRLDFAKPGQKDPRLEDLKGQLSEIRSKVAVKKAARGKIEDQIKNLQDSINARIKDLNSKRHNMPYRSVADLEAAVAKLDRDVSSGRMKIVDEKKALQEISNLNRQRKNFTVFEEQQKIIDTDKERLKEMKEKKQDPELKELNDNYGKLDEQFKAIKAEQDSAYKDFNSLRDERTRLTAVQQEKWSAVKQVQDEYYQNLNAFYAYEKEAKKIRDERRQKERAEYELQKKRAYAAERMETASQPAFTSEIITCESLIAFFDPSSVEAARKAKQAVAPRDLAARPTREVSKPTEGRILKKQEEDYFVGTGGKKKGKKNRSAPVAAAEEAPAAAASGKINLNIGILEELAKVDVPAPASRDDYPKVLEKLREKLQHYKDNQDRVTKENIAKVQKEIEKLDRQAETQAATNGASEKAGEGVEGWKKVDDDAPAW